MKKILKHLGALVFCTLYRFIRIIPNNDPIMGFALPFARYDRWWQAALFPFLAMAFFDTVTNRIGIWTIVTAVTYGFIGLVFSFYLKSRKEIGLGTYAKSAVAGILFFDIVTGPLASSLIFRMPFELAAIGQIPFTISHLFTGVILTLLISPMVDPALQRYSILHRIRVHLPLEDNQNRKKLGIKKSFS